MKQLYSYCFVAVLGLLTGCSSQPVNHNATLTDGKPEKIPTSSDNINSKSALVSSPEAQIIHELYQSGCLIKQFELNRVKQQMRISCSSNDIDAQETHKSRI